MVRLVLAAVGLSLLVRLAPAEGSSPEPPAHERTAARVLTAQAAGDAAALAALARGDDLRPWMVVDTLLGQGKRDAALAFAKATGGVDVETLPAYVARWTASEEERTARDVLRRARTAHDEGKLADALEILAGAPNKPSALLAVRLAWWRGQTLRSLRRPAKAEEAFGRCGELAESIGWLSRAADACLAARDCAHSRRDLDGTIRRCEHALRIQRRRERPVLEGQIHADLSSLLRERGKLDESRAHMDRARSLLEPRAAQDPEAARGLAWGLANLGGYEALREMNEPALDHLAQALALMRKREDHGGIAYCLVWVGNIHLARGRTGEARSALEEALEEGRAPGAGGAEGYARGLLGELEIHRDAFREAIVHLTRAREVFRAQRNAAGEAVVAADLAWASWHLGRPKESRRFQAQAMALVDRIRGWPVFHVQGPLARTLWRLGHLLESQGEHAAARTSFASAHSIFETLGSASGRANCLSGLGLVHWRRAEFRKATDAYERAAKLRRDAGDLLGEAEALCNLGLVHDSLGAYQQALACFRGAQEIEERTGGTRSGTFLNLGMIHNRLGHGAASLSLHERALRVARDADDRSGEALALGNLAIVLQHCGDGARAREVLVETARLWERIGNPRGVAQSQSTAALLHIQAGEPASAVPLLRRNVEAWVGLGDREREAAARSLLGWSLIDLGELPAARETLVEARRIQEAIGDRAGVLHTETAQAEVLSLEGRHDEAVALLRRVLEEADRLGSPRLAVNALGGIGESMLARKNYAGAVAACRESVRRLGTLMRGFGEEQGASRRAQLERSFGAYEEGARAAAALGSVADLCFFLESGRAGGLLESLGGRERMRGVAIPDRLREEDTEARAAELVARRDIRERIREGEEPTEAERRALREARKRVVEVVERIQREAKLAAGVVYPKADSLVTIQGRLRDDEALVLYGLYEAETVALVVTTTGSRVARLGDTRPIEEASRGLVRLGRPGGRGVRPVSPTAEPVKPEHLVAALRARVVAPLKLGKTVTRVLVSPDGALSAVPFCLLFGDRDVAYEPSGTVLGAVIGARDRVGRGVLAVGDPIPGGRLDRLAGSGEEARAVGDVVLLREKATETALRAALGTRPRWRSLHLACHGLVDPASPQMSALALTPDDESDGFLTAVEVFELGVSADLVTLSACSTGRGKVYAAEGVMGLTRAFIVAGASRVLCSLWDVSDEATKALMLKFYALWNPRAVGEGLPAARALRLAQQHVRNHPDHPEWRAPYFWAAWMLWGDPD